MEIQKSNNMTLNCYSKIHQAADNLRSKKIVSSIIGFIFVLVQNGSSCSFYNLEQARLKLSP